MIGKCMLLLGSPADAIGWLELALGESSDRFNGTVRDLTNSELA
jgi:hypothetical protein